MKKYITDKNTGLKYELVGDYYLIAGDEEINENLIGIWGQRHYDYLRNTNKVLFSQLILNGKLNEYLADINGQAEEMFSRLVIQLADSEGIPNRLKEKHKCNGFSE